MAIIVDKLPPLPKKGANVAIDTEITGIPAGKLHRPAGNFYLLSAAIDGDKNQYVYTTIAAAQKFMAHVADYTHVYHNGIFDIRQIRRFYPYPYRENYADTLLIEKIMWNGYYDSFSLAAVAARRLGVRLNKGEREEIVKHSGKATKAHIHYAAMDAKATLEIYEDQLGEWATYGNDFLWHEIEKPMMFAILDFQPFTLDVMEWARLANEAEKATVAKAKEMPINARSPKQVKEMLEAAGIHLKDTRAGTLERYAELPEVQAILSIRDTSKKANAFGLAYLDKYVENGNQIYCSINQIGAVTGRLSGSDPNPMQVPNEKPYRACFIAPPGYKFIVADFNAQEPRFTAQVSGDVELLKLFASGRDVHMEAARVVFPHGNFDDPAEAKKLRTAAKPIGLGLVYGLTKYGLAKRIGESVEVAERYRSLYLGHYAGVNKYLGDISRKAKEREHVTTLAGRQCWINPYSWNVSNAASNYPIQGSGADLIKYSIVLVYKQCMRIGIDMPIITPVHDEIVAVAPTKQAKKVAKIIKDSMTAAFVKLCPDIGTKNLVEPVIGNSWADK